MLFAKFFAIENPQSFHVHGIRDNFTVKYIILIRCARFHIRHLQHLEKEGS